MWYFIIIILLLLPILKVTTHHIMHLPCSPTTIFCSLFDNLCLQIHRQREPCFLDQMMVTPHTPYPP